jgi:hypothetical protein
MIIKHFFQGEGVGIFKKKGMCKFILAKNLLKMYNKIKQLYFAQENVLLPVAALVSTFLVRTKMYF